MFSSANIYRHTFRGGADEGHQNVKQYQAMLDDYYDTSGLDNIQLEQERPEPIIALAENKSSSSTADPKLVRMFKDLKASAKPTNGGSDISGLADEVSRSDNLNILRLLA